MTRNQGAVDWLLRSWWILFPCFTALTIRLTIERACGAPYDLLPALTSEPGWAWPLALVYVLAHAWILGAYLVTVSHTQALLPSVSGWRSVWGANVGRIILMLMVFAIDYSPVPMWRLIGPALACAR